MEPANAIRLAIVQTDISYRKAVRYSGGFVVGNIGSISSYLGSISIIASVSQQKENYSGQMDIQPPRELPYSFRLYNKSWGIEEDKTV